LSNLEVISAVGSTLNDGPGHDWKYLFSPVEMKLGELRSDNKGLTCNGEKMFGFRIWRLCLL